MPFDYLVLLLHVEYDYHAENNLYCCVISGVCMVVCELHRLSATLRGTSATGLKELVSALCIAIPMCSCDSDGRGSTVHICRSNGVRGSVFDSLELGGQSSTRGRMEVPYIARLFLVVAT